MTILWTIYLAVMLWLTYDLLISDISRIVRRILPNDEIFHLSLVCILWAIYYMYYLN